MVIDAIIEFKKKQFGDFLIHTFVKRKHTKNKDPTAEDIASFLNTPPPPKESTKCSDVQSIWSIVRKSLQRFDLSVSISPGFQVQLIHPEGVIDPSKRKVVSKVVRMEAQAHQLKTLIDAPDQGRAFHLISKCADSNHWIAARAFTSFVEHRFAIKAHLNLLPTKSVVQRTGKQIDVTCARCKTQPETLAHVLSSCTPNTGI